MIIAKRLYPPRIALKFLVLPVLLVFSAALSAATATVDDVRAIARLYSAAFDREPLEDGLNFWVRSFEAGASLTQIAARFNQAPEFTRKYGPLDNTEYVEQLFRNVLGRDGAPEGIDFWVGNLEDGISRAKILERFSESPENVAKTTDIFADMRLEDGAWTFASIFTNNLVAGTLDITTAFPRIGYPLELTIEIEALEPTENVTVALFAIDKGRENIRQLVLDTATIDLVVAGRNTYFFAVEVPTSLAVAGPYFIGALVDAADFIGETDETDNEASIETTLSPAEDPNLMVDSLQPDRNAIVLDRDSYSYAEQAALGVVNSDAGGTLSWRVNGAAVPIDVEVFATLRLNRSDLGASYSVPLYLWNSDEERYMNAYGVAPDSAGVATDVEWLPIGSVGQLSSEGANGQGGVTLSELIRALPTWTSISPAGWPVNSRSCCATCRWWPACQPSRRQTSLLPRSPRSAASCAGPPPRTSTRTCAWKSGRPIRQSARTTPGTTSPAPPWRWCCHRHRWAIHPVTRCFSRRASAPSGAGILSASGWISPLPPRRTTAG